MLQIVSSILDSSSESSDSDEDVLTAILNQDVESNLLSNCTGSHRNNHFSEFIGLDVTVDSAEEYQPPVKRRKAQRNVVAKYFDPVIIASSIDVFTDLFHISRSSFEELANLLASNEVTAGRPSLPQQDSLLIAVWTLTNQEPFRCIAQRFRVSLGHCIRIFHDTCQKIFKLCRKYIRWPVDDEAETTTEEFSAMFGLSKVIGCLGTTHILIPNSNKDLTYYDSKGNNSIILQGVCNSRLEFMNISMGWPGSMHYGRVWTSSALHGKLTETEEFIPNGTFLVGNDTYPLNDNLMVPYREEFENGTLTIKEKQFNAKLEEINSLIQKAFGRLKGTFQRVQFLNIMKMDSAKHVVTAACILHNISIQDGVQVPECVDPPYRDLDADELDPVYLICEDRNSAENFRANLTEAFFTE